MPDRIKVNRFFFSVTLFMFMVALAADVTPVADLDGIAHQSTVVVSEPDEMGMLVAGAPHGPIAIDGDGNFSDTALLEGWPGDGSPENPYIIGELDIDLGGEYCPCIGIQNTRVSFTISNCRLTGAGGPFGQGGDGIILWNVMNGELVENIVDSNGQGIYLQDSDYNRVVNNSCTNNIRNGICLEDSHSNAVVNNICFNNTHFGIVLFESSSNTVANNICNSNGGEYGFWGSGILLGESHHNTVANNICSNNTEFGISFFGSSSNTITGNTLNGCGFFFTGGCRQIKVTGNSVNTLPLMFLQDQVGNVVSSPAGQVILVGCSQVTVKDQTLVNCSVGVLLCHTNLTTLVNNTCNSNLREYDYERGYTWMGRSGIRLDDSHSNTVVNNTCKNNIYGISLVGSHSNTLVNNTCNRNDIGVSLVESNSNTVANNTCNNNRIGIELYESYSNAVANNTFLGNTEHDIIEEFEPEMSESKTPEPDEFDPVVLLLIGFAGVAAMTIMVVRPWRLAEERRRILYKDDISIPVRHRLVSWLKMRRSISDADIDEDLEHDSSD